MLPPLLIHLFSRILSFSAPCTAVTMGKMQTAPYNSAVDEHLLKHYARVEQINPHPLRTP